MENQTEDKKTNKLGLLTVLGYGAGFLFIPAGIANMFMTGVLSGLIIVLAGLSVFPPFWKFVRNKYSFELSRALKVMLFFILLAVGGGIVGNDLDVEDTSTPSNTKPTIANTEELEMKSKVQQETTPEPVIEKEPVTLSGTGQQATETFHLDKGLTRFEMTHTGSGHFGVWLLDSEGNNVALLANEVGSFDGSKAERINKSGEYLLDVSANGSWTVSIK